MSLNSNGPSGPRRECLGGDLGTVANRKCVRSHVNTPAIASGGVVGLGGDTSERTIRLLRVEQYRRRQNADVSRACRPEGGGGDLPPVNDLERPCRDVNAAATSSGVRSVLRNQSAVGVEALGLAMSVDTHVIGH